MTQITYIKSSLRHSSALTTPEVALSQFGLWKSIKRAFKKFAKPLAAIVGIAASIAVPFIAPAVAGLIFGGTALGAGAIGAAIAGAGMGAAAGALTAYGTGQNILTGALLGGLGGGLGGGVSGFASSGGTLMGSTASGVYGAGMAGSAVSGPGAGGLLASAVPGTTAPGAAGAAGAGTAGTTAATASTGIGSRLLEASLKAAPAAIGTLVSSLAPSDVPQATAELQAEMARLQNSDIDAYNKAKVLYDQLYARYQQIDPVAAAQLAEADVQTKTAGLISEVGRTVPRGAASGEYNVAAEQRRIAVTGAGEGTQAYTNAYYQGENAKTQALAGLTPPRYQSSSGDYLTNRLAAAEKSKVGLASDVSGFLTPYALALAPKDTTLTSDEADRLRKERDLYKNAYMDKGFTSPT